MSSFQSLLTQYRRRDAAGSRTAGALENVEAQDAATAADRSFLVALTEMQGRSGAGMGELLDLVVECGEVAA